MRLYYTTYPAGTDPHRAAWALLARALALHGYRLSDFALSYGARGKPFFTEQDAPAFSISHTKTLAAVVLAPAGMSVGADAEPCTRTVSSAVAKRFLGSAFGGTDVRAWTRRESFGKYTGEGAAAQALTPDPRTHRFATYSAAGHLLTVCYTDGKPPILPIFLS